MTIEDTLRLVDEMKKRGVIEFSTPDVTVKFDLVGLHLDKQAETALDLPSEAQQATERFSQTPSTNTENDLYWSV